MSAVSCVVTGWLDELIVRAELSSDDWVRNLPVTLDHLRTPNRHVDWDLFATLSERLEALFGGEGIIG